MIHANQWVSLSASTSRPKTAIFSITILVKCLGASFAFPWHKIKKHCEPAQKFRHNNSQSKTAQNNLHDPLKLH